MCVYCAQCKSDVRLINALICTCMQLYGTLGKTKRCFNSHKFTKGPTSQRIIYMIFIHTLREFYSASSRGLLRCSLNHNAL